MTKVGVVLFLLANFTEICLSFEQIERLVTKWAPLVWLAPEEKYFPSGVNFFFQNVHLANEYGKSIMLTLNVTHFPEIQTKSLFLVTTRSLEDLETNKVSFLNGHNPKLHTVPTYVLIQPCTPNTSFRASDITTIRNDIINILYKKPNPRLFFSVSYWTFYPYNQGKKICFIGNVPTLTFFGRCFGRLKTIGDHVGDWEHMSLSFKGNPFPSEMYVAIHDTGGYYKFDQNFRHFKLNSYRTARRVQNPKLPPIVRVQGGHPVLFAAEGSHGLWPAPGEHEYLKIPFLTDKCGYGTPWKTWENLEIYTLGNQSLPKWLLFKGKWGNPKSNCMLSKKLGLCEHTDGPPGILRSRQEFPCYQQ